MGFGGYDIAKAGPAGYNAVAARNGDEVVRQMQIYLDNANRKRNAMQLVASPLPRDPQWDASTFGPSYPLVAEPLDEPGKGRHDTQADPRIFEYPVAWNVTIGRERHVPWHVLKESSQLPVFRACIELRKTELSSMEWGIRVNPKVASRMAIKSNRNGDQVAAELRAKHQDEIDRLETWWQYPDKKNGRNFSEWISLCADEQLTHDALAIYPWQTYGGETLGLWVLDGATIMPLLDETGGRPASPLAAYQQILYGFPRGEFTAQTYIDPGSGKLVVPNGLSQSQLVYRRRTPRTTTPYGYSATEQALLDGLLYNKRFGWMIQNYTEGVMPTMFMESDGTLDWTPEQLLDYERQFNNRMQGMTAERMKAQFLPPGLHPGAMQDVAQHFGTEYDLYLVKLIAMHFNCTASELGFTDSGGLGSTGYHEGQEDINYRRGRLPDFRWFADLCTELSISYLGMDSDLEFYFLGLDSEDESESDSLMHDRVADGRMTLNEARAALNLTAYSFPEADQALLETERGVVFLDGASKLAPPGMLIEPQMLQQSVNGAEPASGVGPRSEGTPKTPQAREEAARKDAEAKAYENFMKKGHKRPFRFEVFKDQAEVELYLAAKAAEADPKVRAMRNWSLRTEENYLTL